MATDSKQSAPARIFLSHKSVDKSVVRDYHETLELLGLRPWLDEKDLRAGSELHRALQQGMKESCAAVFFITPAYEDEKFLRAEINHAIAEKTERGDDFSIITLVLADPDGRVGSVPEPLQPYVWKRPKTPLEGLRDILRALPAPFRDIRPVVPTLTAGPDVRTRVAAGQIITPGSSEDTIHVIYVRIENHGTQPIYLTGSVSFARDDVADRTFLVTRDALGYWWPERRALSPGDGFDIPIALKDIPEHVPHIAYFFFRDELGRVFKTDEAETRAALKPAQEP